MIKAFFKVMKKAVSLNSPQTSVLSATLKEGFLSLNTMMVHLFNLAIVFKLPFYCLFIHVFKHCFIKCLYLCFHVFHTDNRIFIIRIAP